MYYKQTSLQRLLQNKLNTVYFTCDKLKDRYYNIFILRFCIYE